MSIPKPPTRKPTPIEVAAAWQQIFQAVLAELVDFSSLPEERATEVAAYVAATLTKEAKHGNQPRNN